MRLTPLFFAAVALFGLTAATYKNSKFSIDFPDGWSAPTADTDGTMESRAPDAAGAAWCRANSVSLTTLESSQEEINALYSAPIDRETWADVLTVDPANLRISDGAARIVDGRIVQFATIVFAPDVFGSEVKASLASYILHGRMVNAACFTPSSSFEGMKAMFETVVTSLKPL